MRSPNKRKGRRIPPTLPAQPSQPRGRKSTPADPTRGIDDDDVNAELARRGLDRYDPSVAAEVRAQLITAAEVRAAFPEAFAAPAHIPAATLAARLHDAERQRALAILVRAHGLIVRCTNPATIDRELIAALKPLDDLLADPRPHLEPYHRTA